ncbi:MAG TPA: Stk1 family PASTA domain-containing Ser/Thr kinase [Mycobacteriales bacterium]|nr:Stk1 family PASTA domain-containing Ser/Thr kinase [Mycobacteriales bacterium]
MARRILIGGRYELGPIVGQGGMAEVHRGRDTRIDRQVAIKLLRSDLTRDPSFRNRFRREAQSAAALNSPSIVAVYDTGEDRIGGRDTPYIVMEYVEGETLRDLLATEGRLSPQRALQIAAAICQALELAHVAGIVHRDIKPGNVMITPSGEVKVMDFGIARALTSSTSTMTETATVIGTAHYLSPEQARGEHVDARSDVYSTGCLLYELLTGAPPFTGESAVAVAYQHVREDPLPPSSIEPDIPKAADAIVLTAMAKNPADRYATAGEMRADLERALAGRRVHATPVIGGGSRPMPEVPPTTVLLREPRRSRHGSAYLLLGLGCVAVFAIVVLIARSLLGPGAADLHTPNVVGLQYGDAQSTLASDNLRVGNVTFQYTRKDNRGQVLDQTPPAGILINKGVAIDLVVSRGIRFVSVPTQLVGLNVDAATAALQAVDLRAGPTVQRNSDKPAGQVLATRPVAGQSVPAGSKVTLVVSNGQIKVPKVVGFDADTATAMLEQAGFSVKQQRAAVFTRRKEGLVVDQAPSAGSFAQSGSTVVIFVDEKAPPKTSPSPTNSPSTSPSPTDSASPTG